MIAASKDAAPRTGAGERVRVVTLVDRLSRQGGAENLAWLIATRLDRERFSSTLSVSRWPPASPDYCDPSSQPALEELREHGTGFLPLVRTRRVDFAALSRLAGFLRRERVHVLHAHKFGSNAWAAIAGRLARVPVVLAHEHTWSYEGQPLRRAIDRDLIARFCDRFIAVSREDQRRMIEIERIAPERTLFIPLGVPAAPPPTGRDVRSELGIAPDVPVLGCVGVMRAQKRHDVLVRALALLHAGWPQAQLLIVGGGPERAALEELARELGVSDCVHMLGQRSDISDVLRAFDVAVSSSDFEGSPLSIKEYMEAALPIVATRVGGVPDLIEDRVHGLLVPPRDPDALAGAISQLLDDRDAAHAMGRRAQERRRSEFDIDTFIGRLEALYGELLAAKGVRT